MTDNAEKRTKACPLTNVLGYPRIGKHRELKKACEAFWGGRISREELLDCGKNIRRENWLFLKGKGIDLIPSNDFSFYDQMLDMSLMVGAVPERYSSLKGDKLELYFAMAHGEQKEGSDVIAMEMTKWFDTNYHYIVPEFVKDQEFTLFDTKAIDEYKEAARLGIKTKPVLVGPVSYLLLGKEKQSGFNRLDLLDRLLPVYVKTVKALEDEGAEWIQFDEPMLALDLNESEKFAYEKAYNYLRNNTCSKTILTTYFDGLNDNAMLACQLPVAALHIDLVRAPQQFGEIVDMLPPEKKLSLGIIDGRNIWKDDLSLSLEVVNRAVDKLGADRVMVSTSCSLLHVPCDLELEDGGGRMRDIKKWLAFAAQKAEELETLKELASGAPCAEALKTLEENRADIADKHSSALIHDNDVAKRTRAVKPEDMRRRSPYAVRRERQQARLNLPLFPTTTIGSFPQTKEVRSWRAKFRKDEISQDEYTRLLKEETGRCIRRQEQTGLDVLVHGEFERNDMVEYFGEHLNGFAFTCNGWVQSYGSRCVKPPVIFGDVSRSGEMTVEWSRFAQSLTALPVKGMLTGPVTIEKWSFVRNDQPLSETCRQISLAIRDEVCDLERNGIKVIQIDEPAIREALPLRRSDRAEYLKWAVECFRIASCGVEDDTQIHTHMCYSEFNDIIEHIARMDADVITMECSRSQMELLDVFGRFEYPNDIGPGVYDIHSPRVPGVNEMLELLRKASALVDVRRLWVNPDCGLKTRGWEETLKSLENMVAAAREMRREYSGVSR